MSLLMRDLDLFLRSQGHIWAEDTCIYDAYFLLGLLATGADYFSAFVLASSSHWNDFMNSNEKECMPRY